MSKEDNTENIAYHKRVLFMWSYYLCKYVKTEAKRTTQKTSLHNNVYVHVVLLALQMCETNRGSKIREPN